MYCHANNPATQSRVNGLNRYHSRKPAWALHNNTINSANKQDKTIASVVVVDVWVSPPAHGYPLPRKGYRKYVYANKTPI